MFRTLRFYHSFFKFLSTPSSRRATQDQIHHLWRGGHFYPRPPRGGRPGLCGDVPQARRISIHALREEGDNLTAYALEQVENFYPRPPRGGRRGGANADKFMRENFYPRPPRGGRPFPVSNSESRAFISIHALREEGDLLLFISANSCS